MEGTYIDAVERNEEGKFVSNLIECPDELLIFMTQYIEGGEFMDRGLRCDCRKMTHMTTVTLTIIT